MKRFDVAVIGAGSLGVRAAVLAAANGASVVLADTAAQARAIGYDDSVGHRLFIEASAEPRANWSSIKKYVAAETERRHDRYDAESLRAKGIRLAFGPIRMHEDISLSVGSDKIAAKRVLIATPAPPRMPVSMGLKKDMVVVSGNLYKLRSKPRSVVVVGAGITGVETAYALSRMGVTVHLVDHNPRILKELDEEASRIVTDRLAAHGVHIYTSASIPKVAAAKGGKTVTISRYHNLVQVKVSHIVLATGPALRQIRGLKHLVQIEDGTISVDDMWRTSNHRIYAINDNTDRICGYGQSSQPLVSAVMHIVKGAGGRTGFAAPYAIRVEPEIATVGPTESRLTREGITFEVLRFSYEDLGIPGQPRGFVKLLVDDSRRIMSATTVGSGAADSIGYFAHMAADGDTVDDLRELLVPDDTLVGRFANRIPAKSTATFSPVRRFFMTFAKK